MSEEWTDAELGKVPSAEQLAAFERIKSTKGETRAVDFDDMRRMFDRLKFDPPTPEGQAAFDAFLDSTGPGYLGDEEC